MSVIGVGIDLVDIERVRQMWARHGERIERRMLTAREAAYVHGCAEPARHTAARVAAKEAVYKAMQSLPGARAIAWTDIEVRRTTLGAPYVELHGRAAAIAAATPGLRIHLSLTHATYAASAVAIAESLPSNS